MLSRSLVPQAFLTLFTVAACGGTATDQRESDAEQGDGDVSSETGGTSPSIEEGSGGTATGGSSSVSTGGSTSPGGTSQVQPDGCPASVSQDPDAERPDPGQCGDGIISGQEACDDGNADSGDGCHKSCNFTESGFLCPCPGQPCFPYAVCGNSRVELPEECDDGNTTDGDSCSSDCLFEFGGNTCESVHADPAICNGTCGDGILSLDEECDSGNPSDAYNQCNANCKLNEYCGDLIVNGDEACDQKDRHCTTVCQWSPLLF